MKGRVMCVKAGEPYTKYAGWYIANSHDEAMDWLLERRPPEPGKLITEQLARNRPDVTYHTDLWLYNPIVEIVENEFGIETP